MAANKNSNIQIEQYSHSRAERANKPHVGLVTPDSDPDTGENKKYQYDHILIPSFNGQEKLSIQVLRC